MAYENEVTAAVRDLLGVQDRMAEAKDIWAEIPTSTKQALAKKWVLKATNFASDKALEYSPEQMEIDHRRIIMLPAALTELQFLEAELVRTQVLDLEQLLWKRWKTARRLWQALHVAWNDVWGVLRALWDFVFGVTQDQLAAALSHLWAGLAASAALIAEILSAKAFIEVALSVMRQRDKCIARLRKKALPQPPAKRYRRRKRAR